MATIIAAITKAAVATNMMRLISTTLPVEGRSKKGVKPPPCLLAPSVLISVLGNSEGIKRAGASTPRLSATLLVVGWLISPLGYYLDTHGVGTLVLFRYLGR
jgi:hypothetical protein